jgi:hypothetical protein
MVKLLLIVSVIAIGAIVYPRYAEHSDDACGALGKRLEALAGPGRPQSPPIRYDDFARAAMQAKFPEVPEALRCTVGYWMVVATPEVAEVAKRVAPK